MVLLYDYLPTLGPPLTEKEKEEAEEVLAELREEAKRLELPIPTFRRA